MQVFSFSFVHNDESTPVVLLATTEEALNEKVTAHLLGMATFRKFLADVRDEIAPIGEDAARLTVLAGEVLENKALLDQVDMEGLINEFFEEFLEAIDGFSYEVHELGGPA